MLLVIAALGFLQAPQVAAAKPPIERIYRKKQVDRYSVTLDSDIPNDNGEQKTHIQYEMRMAAEHDVPETKNVAVKTTFLNRKERIDGEEAPSSKIFGVVSCNFPPSGLPTDFSFAKGSALVIPLLSWYTPTDTVSKDQSFDVTEMVFDTAIHVSGKGVYKALDERTASVTVEFDLTSPELAKGFSANGSVFHSTARFNLKTGVLLMADGDMKRPDGGTLTFHIKKL